MNDTNIFNLVTCYKWRSILLCLKLSYHFRTLPEYIRHVKVYSKQKTEKTIF